ncbi:hypothetical protein LV28_25145 [Pandoraea pnomenusa]|uniref:FUSC family membrane protein n=1 Tax=Pandoraea pnomenusa TaxID=93220 RepID=UPI00071E8F37|nr:FUSC family membrane protein [Pandoraea pnomenusa]ALR35896.1 hypothetical protein LV28_25145 [Pandoraea pnomenusa]
MSASTEPGRRVAWVSRLARLEPVAFSRWDAVHAALSVAIPTAIGAAIGHGADASLIALGALPAITGDRTGPYRSRARSILLTIATGVVGFHAGMLIHDVGLTHPWLAHVLLQLAILLLSFAGTFGNVASAATLQGAIYLLVGWGLALPPPEWRAPLLLAAGGVFSVLLMAIHWLRHPGAAERDAVAAIYQQLANVLDASGTPRVRLARRSLENAIAAACDTLLTARASTASGRDLLERRAAQVLAAEPMTSAVIALAQGGNPCPHRSGVHCMASLEASRVTAPSTSKRPPPWRATITRHRWPPRCTAPNPCSAAPCGPSRRRWRRWHGIRHGQSRILAGCPSGRGPTFGAICCASVCACSPPSYASP